MDQTTFVYECKRAAIWALANALGWLAAMSILCLDDSNYSYVSPWLILCGLAIGLAQWLVLVRYFSHSPWWIPAYGLGWYLGLLAGFHSFLVPNWLSMGATGGIGTGILQWLMFRRRVPRSLVWIPSVTLSSLAGCLLGVLVGVHAYDSGIGIDKAYLLGGTVAGALIGLLSGIVLVWLLRNRHLRQSEQGVESPA